MVTKKLTNAMEYGISILVKLRKELFTIRQTMIRPIGAIGNMLRLLEKGEKNSLPHSQMRSLIDGLMS